MTCKIHHCHCSTLSKLTYDIHCHPGPRCKHQYCWVCLADFREIHRLGNTAHQESCRYHSNNLPTVAAVTDRVLHRDAAAEQAAEDMMDRELERARGGDYAAAHQATENTMDGGEQNPQARPTGSPRPSLRHRRTSRPVNTSRNRSYTSRT